jgi:hypothetical protein
MLHPQTEQLQGIRFILLSANKDNNGLNRCAGKVHEILGSNILTVALATFPGGLYTQHLRVFLFDCSFFVSYITCIFHVL